MVACAVTTDTVLLSIVGGKVRGAAADGVGFVTFFYAALTAFETALVLAYHLNAGNRPRQIAAMGSAAAIQVVVTSLFFVVFPGVLLGHAYRPGDMDGSTISPHLLALLVSVNLLMFAVEISIARIRIAIARRKLRQHRHEQPVEKATMLTDSSVAVASPALPCASAAAASAPAVLSLQQEIEMAARGNEEQV